MPIIESDIPRVSPTIVVIQLAKYDDNAIHVMHIKNVIGYQKRNLLYLVSGIVMKSTNLIGHVKMNFNIFNISFGGKLKGVSGNNKIHIRFIRSNFYLF